MNRTTRNRPPADVVAGDTLGPVLQLVREQSVPELDACEEEILRQAQDAHPALPSTADVPARSWAALTDRRAS